MNCSDCSNPEEKETGKRDQELQTGFVDFMCLQGHGENGSRAPQNLVRKTLHCPSEQAKEIDDRRGGKYCSNGNRQLAGKEQNDF